ncbi:MAG: AI-2E family transporter [Rhodospirillaceae bacterium]
MSRGLRTIVLASLALTGVYLCARIALPFFTPIAAAFILAVLFSPFHERVGRRIGNPTFAALASVLVICGITLSVLLLIIAQLVREAASGAVLVRAAFERGIVDQMLAGHPAIAPLFRAVFDRLNAAGLAAEAASWLTNVSGAMLRGSLIQIAGGLLTLYLLFYFLRDKSAAIGALRSFLPFTEAETAAVFRSAVDTVHATVYGMLVTGIFLGILGGAIFAAVGLPAPALWGTVMAIFAILPVLGIGMIWMPAAAWLVLGGNWIEASVMTAAFIALSAADFVIYPFLIGNRMKLHSAVAFVAAVGGLIVFGAVGFVVGPLIIALMLTFGEIVAARAKGPRAPDPPPPASVL